MLLSALQFTAKICSFGEIQANLLRVSRTVERKSTSGSKFTASLQCQGTKPRPVMNGWTRRPSNKAFLCVRQSYFVFCG